MVVFPYASVAFSCLILLCCVCISSPTDLPVPAFPGPDWRSAHLQVVSRRDTISYLPSLHVNVTLAQPRQHTQRLGLELVQSATTWLHVRWRLHNKTGASVGVPRFSRVTCHIGNTTTVVHDVAGSGTQFRIPNLSSNTQYLVCVETETVERVLYYRCSPFRTIPLVRPDSVLGLLLTLGYILLMGVLGYVTWCMRVRRYVSSRKAGGNELELSCRTSTIRFSEIEERVQGNSSPFCPTADPPRQEVPPGVHIYPPQSASNYPLLARPVSNSHTH
ncbi:hypothetical protein ACOMHN_020557 [Nucella lapillus]